MSTLGTTVSTTDIATTADLSTHAGAADPHAGYLTPAEGNAAYQPVDSDLTAIAALTTTAFGRALLALADPADATKYLDGTGVYSVPGGGGAPTTADYLVGTAQAGLSNEIVVTAAGLALLDDAAASNQRATLGLVIGTDVQAQDADIAIVSASQGEMETGTEAALRSMSPLRVAQAIAALGGGGATAYSFDYFLRGEPF